MLLAAAVAQQAVPVGKGSYAEFPPPSAGKAAAEMVGRKFPLVDRSDRPIPTNKLWTSLLDGKAAGSLWMYPWRVDPRESGLELHLPLKWSGGGNDPLCDAPLRIGGVDFRAGGLKVKDWGDWTLSFRLPQSATRYLDVTVGEGMPIVWVESQGVELTVDAGREATFTARGDATIISASGRLYAAFTPPGAKFIESGGRMVLRSAAGKSFAAFAALKSPGDLAAFAQCAYSIPRDSRMDWSYDARRGKVTTTWTVKTEPLREGKADVVLQGWLAHHWRDAASDVKLTGPTYLTPRGPLRTSLGNAFQWVYDFDGFLPGLPAPVISAAHSGSSATEVALTAFDPKRMAQLLEYCAKNPQYGDDSYWGGKDLLRFAQYMQMARELKSPTYARLRELSRKSLVDWLTYTPGEKAHYFTRYENWHALIGIKDSYDSARFNDQHFHYGYLTFSAALLGMEDPEFLADYAGMLRQVAKQYANWDRRDRRFPLLRTFDIWAGHSWAGGLGSPGGNNQESTSEAMQSWIGLYLLGTMLDDAEMTAAGAMGYAMESRASMEYWFNLHGDILPAEYKHPIVGVLWSGGQVYGTYFSGDPGWIYGIQCLPQSPGLDYLVRDPRFASDAFRAALAARKAKEGSDDLAAMGDLGNVLLAQASLADPAWAAAQFDRLWEAGSPIVHKHFGAGTTYYNAHAYRNLGRRLWNVHLSLPTSAAYYNSETKAASCVVYNSKPYPVTVEATRDGKSLGALVAPPRQLTCVHKLQPLSAKAGLSATLPADGETAVSRRMRRVYVAFHAAVDSNSLAGIRLKGPGEPATTLATEDDGRVVAIKLAEPLAPGTTYQLQIPATVKMADGTPAVAQDRNVTFTLEPQPPLALESSLPADGQDHVAAADPAMLLTFNAAMDARGVQRIRLQGPGEPALSARVLEDRSQVRLHVAGRLESDAEYAIVLPAGLASAGGDTLAAARMIRFVTQPAACPPNVYRESFAGGGYGADQGLEVDLRNSESPHSGRYAIKLHAAGKSGTVYFFAGSSDHGDGRKGIDLSKYRLVEFWMKGNADGVWAKIGHPVFDHNAFHQARLTGVTSSYKRFSLEIPRPGGDIGTLLAISVPDGATIFLDDIRFVGAR